VQKGDKGGTAMNEKKRDKGIVKEAIGDPAFYNDQIGENKEPLKELVKNKKDDRCKKGC
jgi:ribosomal protein L1